jgi:hypothetical protein
MRSMVKEYRSGLANYPSTTLRVVPLPIVFDDGEDELRRRPLLAIWRAPP